jgi:hypothetical protein
MWVPLLALPLLALALAGCGGSGGDAGRLPADLGARLARGSERVSAALRAGDSCRAAAAARSLRASATAAIASGRVPVPLQRELGTRVEALADAIVCVRAAPPPPPPPSPPPAPPAAPVVAAPAARAKHEEKPFKGGKPHREKHGKGPKHGREDEQ